MTGSLRDASGEPDPEVIAALAAQVRAASLPPVRIPAGPRGEPVSTPADWVRAFGRRRR